ncbi:MAG: DMT family transporter [Cloacibacillus sp.]
MPDDKNIRAGSYWLAGFVILIWSITFVSTKFLLARLSPTEILFYRVMIALALFTAVSPKRVRLPLKQELAIAAAGCLGTTVYFMCENFALFYGTASNVSLIVSTAPLLTGLVVHVFVRGEPISKKFITGSVFCLVGIAVIVFNGHFILKLNPLGDIIALLAALSFAFYSLIVRNIDRSISMVVITRKSFFYALLSMLPLTLTPLIQWRPEELMRWDVALNLLFLGALASAFCYWAWAKVIWGLGPVKANNLIYLSPPLAILCAALVLHEHITLFALLGGVLTLIGVYISQHEKQSPLE